MNLLTLAVKNVRHQARSYAAFFLSSSFAVWLFYSYAAVLSHPQFSAADEQGTMRAMLAAVEGVVAVFSVLFILYAFSAFLKSRQRELGILTLLGMAPRDLTRMVYLEISLTGLSATSLALALGTVTLKLFFLGIGRLLRLREPMPFHFSPGAVGLTLLVFGIVFAVIAVLGHLQIRRASPAVLVREAGAPQAPPRFSWWLAGLAVGLVGTSYYLALTVGDGPDALPRRIWWVMGTGLAGTYFLFSQVSLFAVRWLQRRPAIYYSHTNLLTISQLAYKLKENARILFMVSVLTTLVLIFVGVYYGGYMTAEQQALREQPINLMVVQEPGSAVTAKAVGGVLSNHGLKAGTEVHLPALQTTAYYKLGPTNTMILSGVILTPASEFNRWLTSLGLGEPVEVPEGKVVLAYPKRQFRGEFDGTLGIGFGEPESGPAAGAPGAGPTAGAPGAGPTAGATGAAAPPARSMRTAAELPIDRTLELRPFNQTRYTSIAAVVSDQTFADLSAQYGDKYGMAVHGYTLPQWKRSGPAIEALSQLLGADDGGAFRTHLRGILSGTYLYFEEARQGIGFFLFLCSFIGLLFFLASGNMLYFKLFTDLKRDRLQFAALYKLGIRPAEIRGVVSTQVFVLFFAPFVVAASHTAVFISMLVREIELDLWQPMMAVAMVYLLLHGSYYLVTRRTYVQALLEGR